MSDPAALLALAERVEAASEGSLQLDIAILSVVGWGTGIRLTRSLDAAVALVPQGLDWSVDSMPSATIHFLNDHPPTTADCLKAATPALALTAAALRARAATREVR